MAKMANHMTRIVAIGKLESYTYDPEKTAPGKGVLDVGGGQKARFTIWNRTNGDNQHTKAADFQNEFSEGDLVFVTGQDNRQITDDGAIFEDIHVWDYRAAEEDEQHRWVFVYVGDVMNYEEDSTEFDLKFVNYKDEEMLYPITLEKLQNVKGDLEDGARIKIKGEIFNGLKMDFFGDGEFVTERRAVHIEVLNSAEEVEEANKPADDSGEETGSGTGLWD